MNILALDTSGPVAGVAILKNGEAAYEAMAVNRFTHSVSLLPMVEEGFTRSGLTIKDIDLFAVTVGPGSFTGVRIGVSTVKGMAHGAGKPCIGINALEALASGIPFFDGTVCPIQDARAGQVYGAAFKAGLPPQRLMADEALKLPEYLNKLEAFPGPCLFVGDGVPVHREMIESILKGKAVFASAHARFLRPLGVALLADHYSEQAVDYLMLMPYYLRAPQAERQRKSREDIHGV
jgi:tRNA threonylcarbamoyladenosine biosynthesis protein TsaB